MTPDPPATFRQLVLVEQRRTVWAALTRHPQASMRELQAATGLGSLAVQHAVAELARLGYITRPARTARSAVVVVPLIEVTR